MRQLFLIMALLPMLLMGQLESQGLRLEHREKKTLKEIPINSRLNILLTDNSHIKGRLLAVTPDSLKVGNRMAAIDQVLYIGWRNLGTDIGGAAITLLGLGMIGSALVPLAQGKEDYVNYGLIGLAGVGITWLGPGLISNGKRYYLDSDWRVVDRLRDFEDF